MATEIMKSALLAILDTEDDYFSHCFFWWNLKSHSAEQQFYLQNYAILQGQLDRPGFFSWSLESNINSVNYKTTLFAQVRAADRRG